jgi:hypothetical protein
MAVKASQTVMIRGPQGDLLAGQPARVAAAVEAFVGGVHQPVEQRYSDAA